MKERKDIPLERKWNTEDIFADTGEFEKCFTEAEKGIDFKKFAGKLNDFDRILEFLRLQDETAKKIERIYLYAHMKKDEDSRDGDAAKLKSRADKLYVRFGSEVSFFTPEVLKLPEEKLTEIIEDKRFADYDYQLKCLLKEKKHVLSKEEEELLASGGEVFGAFSDIFGMIDNADIKFPVLRRGKERIPLSHGTYSMILHGEDRELRQKAFKKYYKSYIDVINTITAVYNGNLKKDVYLSKARKYNSCLEKALSSEDVKTEVYERLLKAVSDSLPLMHKYIGERKRALGVEKLHMYDLYAPIVGDAELKLEYDRAYGLVVEGLKPLGDEYFSLLKKAKEDRWIDVDETKGKRSGAYSTSAFGVHPYVLLNYTKTTHDVFTIAHEMGHALHSYYSNQSQKYPKADYKIFVAEVASTVNEVLLYKHLLNTTKDKEMKKYLLSYYMDMIRTTLFRQTMFAEFEYIVHSRAEKGEALSKEDFCKIYLKLNKKYYGKDVISDKEISYEWCRIPHFYRAFYVYKYATGLTSAIAIAERILKEGAPAVEDYKRFLKSGGSDSPVNLLKIAGVDLLKDKPFLDAMKSFEDTLAEFSAII